MEALAITPPPTSRLHTPPAPRLGYHDEWNPYSEPNSPRRSARLSQQPPSPQILSRHFSDHHLSDPDPNSFGSPRSKKPRRAKMTSPGASPQKKRLPKMDSVRRASGTLTAESAAQAASALGLPAPPANKRAQSKSAGTSRVAGMLPTPAKTPQKPPTEQEKANIQAVARNIFSTGDEAMPQSKNARPSRHVLDSFSAVSVEESFEIFTDTNERVPKVDNSAENPFFGPGATLAQSSEPKPKGKRQMVTVPGEGRMEINDAIGREFGMVTTFRGKKQFTLFAHKDDCADEDEADSPSGPRRSRRAVKPRRLFAQQEPVIDQKQKTAEDEEAVTDIEDHALVTNEVEEAEPQTPLDAVEATPDTPGTPRFAPASPPTTARVTRHGNKSGVEVTPMKTKATRSGSQSPFKSWQVSKGGSAKHGVKRQGKPIQDGPTKRAKA